MSNMKRVFEFLQELNEEYRERTIFADFTKFVYREEDESNERKDLISSDIQGENIEIILNGTKEQKAEVEEKLIKLCDLDRIEMLLKILNDDCEIATQDEIKNKIISLINEVKPKAIIATPNVCSILVPNSAEDELKYGSLENTPIYKANTNTADDYAILLSECDMTYSDGISIDFTTSVDYRSDYLFNNVDGKVVKIKNN